MTDGLLERFDRTRVAWWGVVVVLGVVLAVFVLSFVGTVVLGVFVYYGVRPLHRRVHARIGHRGGAATLTMLFVVLPAVALVGYTGVVAVREFVLVAGPGVTEAVLTRLPGDPQRIGVVLRSPTGVLAELERPARLRAQVRPVVSALRTAGTGLLHLTLALALAFFLLRDGPQLTAWFRNELVTAGGVADAYATAVDADLETVYVGNVITVLAVTVAAVVVYNGFGLVAPAPLRLPVPTLLALSTGLATFVPLVVGKLVYVPVTGYLLWLATRATGGVELLPWVGGFLGCCFVVLDLVPQTFVRPYVSGQTLHSGLVLFAYVFGAALFGWYGLFLGPLVAVFVVQAAAIVLPELVRGNALTTAATTSVGTDPAAARADDVACQTREDE